MDLEGGAASRLPKIGSFDRLSEGTFGLRGRSSDTSDRSDRSSAKRQKEALSEALPRWLASAGSES